MAVSHLVLCAGMAALGLGIGAARADAPAVAAPAAPAAPPYVQVAEDWDPFKRSRKRGTTWDDPAPGSRYLQGGRGVIEEDERRARRIERTQGPYVPEPTTDYSRRPITPPSYSTPSPSRRRY